MNKITKIVISTALVIPLLGVMSSASAGDTAEKRLNAGPSNSTHCLRLDHLGNPSVPVKVYSEDGTEFIGTELLLRPDIYAGQPCRQDGRMLSWNEDFSEGYAYDEQRDTWHRITRFPGPPMSHATIIAIGDSVIMWDSWSHSNVGYRLTF